MVNKTYTASWIIDIDEADTPEQAAAIAERYMKYRKESCWVVRDDATKEEFTIDLGEVQS